MNAAQQQIDRIEQLYEMSLDGEMAAQDAIDEISQIAEHHNRLARGAHFTPSDVAQRLADDAIGTYILGKIGDDGVTQAVSDRVDLIERFAQLIAHDPRRVDVAKLHLPQMRVMDPSCGAGVFLLAAWNTLLRLEQIVNQHAAKPCTVKPSQLYGFDVDPVASYGCDCILSLSCQRAHQGSNASAMISTVDTSLRLGMTVDVVIGNPPFKRIKSADAPDHALTKDSGNLASVILENALATIAEGGQLAMVMPISIASAHSFASTRQLLDRSCTHVCVSHFDAVPQALFADAVQRISLLHASVGDGPCTWYSSRYHRWLKAERAGLLDRVRYVHVPRYDPARSLVKVANDAEMQLMIKLNDFPPAQRFWDPSQTNNTLFYKRRWSYHLLLCDRIPPITRSDGSAMPSELKRIGVAADLDAYALLALYSSTLFAWYFTALSDCRNLNKRELESFPVPQLDERSKHELAAAGHELMHLLWQSAHERICTYKDGSTITNTYFRQGQTMPAVDRIDELVGDIYGLDADQKRAIHDFDRRFRAPHETKNVG